MKLRGMKVVALAMSALMVASAVPVASFADDAEFYFEEEVADEALVGAEEDEGYFVDFEAEEDFDVVDEEFEEEFAIVGDGEMDDEEVSLVDGSVEYDKNGVFKYQVQGQKSGNIYDRTVNGTNKKTVEATCKEEGYVAYQVTITNLGGKVIYDEEWHVEKTEKLEHDWEDTPFETNYDKDGQPTCTSAGSGVAKFRCKRCGEVKEEPVEKVLEPQGHKLGEFTTEYKSTNANLVIDKNTGAYTLTDPQKGGSYDVFKYAVCSKCGKKIYIDKENNQYEAETPYESVEVKAQEEKYLEITELSDNFADSAQNLIGKRNTDADPVIDDDGNLIIPITDIEMKDCSKGGTITVWSFSGDEPAHRIAPMYIEVAPHHFLGDMGFEFDSETDFNQVKAVKDAKGKVTGFKNINCSREVTYYEVQHCKATGKCDLKKCNAKRVVYNEKDNSVGKHTAETGERIFSEKAIVLPKSTDHVINTTIKKKIADLVKANPNGVDYEELEKLAKEKGSYITVKDNEPNSCDAGTATVSYICKVCGIVVETETVKRAKRAHKWSPLIRELVEDSTCTKKGYYNEYIKCTRCGIKKEGTERKVDKPLKPHEYTQSPTIKFVGGVVVDYDGKLVASAGKADKFQYVGSKAGENGAFEDLSVSAKVVDVCKNCGKEIVVDKATYDIQVVSVNPSDYSCVPGSITLKATGKNGTKDIPAVTASFPYYKSINAYQGRTKHDPGAPEADGTVKCTICGQVITEGQGGQTCEHEAGEATMENIVEATCGQEGSYDLVVKCTKCGEVISTTKVTQEALSHVWGAWTAAVTRTVFQQGKYHRYCANCNKRQTKYLPKLTSICSLDKSSVTVKVGSKVSVKVVKRHRGDTIGSVASANATIAKGFKASSYIAYISGKKVGTTTFTVTMKAGASASCTVKVVK